MENGYKKVQTHIQHNLQHAALLYLLFILSILLIAAYMVYREYKIHLTQKLNRETQLVYWQNVERNNPSDPDIYYKKAVMEYMLQEQVLARTDLETALYLDPTFTQAMELLRKIKR